MGSIQVCVTHILHSLLLYIFLIVPIQQIFGLCTRYMSDIQAQDYTTDYGTIMDDTHYCVSRLFSLCLF